MRAADGSTLPGIGSTYAESSMPDQPVTAPPSASRLYALVAGVLLCLLGVAGFFYDSSFDTGSGLASDYLAGTLLVNGWRNVIYIATGLALVALAPRAPRPAALAVGALYLALGIWGLAETERGIGSILDALPLGDRDNVFHLILGGLGIGAVLFDGGRPKVPERIRRLPRPKLPSRSARGARPRSRAAPRRDAGA
jgi:hypothetical protein